MSKKLIVYYSASGVTADKARALAKETGAELFSIEPVQKYTSSDLDWMNRKSRSTLEMNDKSARPEIKETTDVSGYDTVYIGFPIWWGEAPRVINTFIDSADLEGKTIMLFATSGGTGIRKAVAELKKTYPELDIAGGKLLNGRVTGDIL
ncbi:MAG: flavodoxin [Anaerovoracaceae bacterium]